MFIFVINIHLGKQFQITSVLITLWPQMTLGGGENAGFHKQILVFLNLPTYANFTLTTVAECSQTLL